MKQWAVVVVGVAFVLTACSRGLELAVSFGDVSGLQKGDAVMLDGTQIGKVAKLEQIGQQTRAVLALDPDKATGLRSNAAAMVVSQDAQHAVEIYNSSTGATPIASGHELLAIDSSLELLAWRAGEALDRTNQQLGDALSSMQDYFASPEWQQQKSELQQDLADLEQAVGRSSDQARRELEALLGSLEQESQETAKQLEQQYQTFKQDLTELGEDLARQGKENLLPALEQILSTVRDALEQYQLLEKPPAERQEST